jgi:hypothetical protein
VLQFPLQDFDWQALAARRMEPPRRPKQTDHAKRKVSSCCHTSAVLT